MSNAGQALAKNIFDLVEDILFFVVLFGGFGRARLELLGRQAKLLPAGNRRRDFHGELSLVRRAPVTLAGGARLRNYLARAAAQRTGARHGEKAVLRSHLPVPLALRAGGRRAARRRAGT